MVGAIEFLRKAKAICMSHPRCNECQLIENCPFTGATEDEAELVKSVMDYKIKEED